MKKAKSTSLKQWVWAFIIALALALVCRAFVIQSFIVSNTRMEKTLMAGDFVLVEKLSVGGRIPMTILSVPFTQLYSNFIELPYMRIPAAGSIKRNDILVINYPFFSDIPVDKREPMIKRCVALPGDTLLIKNKQVYANNRKLDFPAKAQFSFRVVTDGSKITPEFTNRFDIHEGGLVSDVGIYDFAITRSTADSLLNDTIIKYVRELKDFEGEKCKGIFPQSQFYGWNKDYFGPVWVPAKGSTVTLNERNLPLYRTIIEVHEKKTIDIRSGALYIDGIATNQYTFLYNYYFVMDDNRDHAKDSRHWGFVPENHIIGKACFVWFSMDKNRDKVRWNRIFSCPN